MDLVPAPLQLEWRQRDRDQPERALLSRMVDAVERAQFGERLPL